MQVCYAGLLRSKMQTAQPDCLIKANTEHQLSLDEQEPSFGRYVDQAIKIAHRVLAYKVDKVAEEAGVQRSPKRAKATAQQASRSKPHAQASRRLRVSQRDSGSCSMGATR